ncbi:Holliday junction resolvase RuvX [Limibacillus halophilus]|uniref:Putative pre-16S rRNA nuclease n=1 Tax=Limibacillus halophilus TaxID=1579333 RepID=A0A839SUG8_9PROT|nr:Holliday junction resolvase RuvX [Limibacillus halophilus]MBB3064583.1 putative Holliday junction resolvase [Limibacillus halophilus]
MKADILDLHELPKRLKPRQRVLGLDLGEKTIGLAISDSGLSLASPLETIRRSKFTKDAAALGALIQERNVGALVIGLPVNMDGSEGPRCQSVRTFAENLASIANVMLPAAFWDERLSTSAVQRFLIDEADMTRQRRGEVVDKMAAAYILQGALDRLSNPV